MKRRTPKGMDGDQKRQLRRTLARGLHRQPCRWDILVAELAAVLLAELRRMRRRLLDGRLVLSRPEALTAACMLARGFDVLVSRDYPPGEAPFPREALWHLDDARADAVADRVVAGCFEPLLRKFSEDAHDVYLPLPDRGLTEVLGALGRAVRTFLVERCAPGGGLHACLADPLADSGGRFPDNGKARDPAGSCGDPFRDVYFLGLTVREDDDGTTFKGKLLHFVRSDPWLFSEHAAALHTELKEPDGSPGRETQFQVDTITDAFLFRATRLDGRTPVQLLLDRQSHLTGEQKRPFLRWDAETFQGVFRIRSIDPPFVETRNLATGRDYRVLCDVPAVLRAFHRGDVFASRITPWEDYWLFSGIQRNYSRLPAKALAELTQKLRRGALYSPEQGDPRLHLAFRKQYEMHEQWVSFFGDEEVLFANGTELEEALARFYRHVWEMAIDPESGMTRAERYRQMYGRHREPSRPSLPQSLKEEKDVGAVFDREHGQGYYVRYGLFRSAFESTGPLSAAQAACVWGYLRSATIPPCLFQRMRSRFPERTQEVLRHVLKDQEFLAERDFEPLLCKFKGEAMRGPKRPSIAIVQSPEEAALFRPPPDTTD